MTKPTTTTFLLLILLLTFLVQAFASADDGSGTFRGKWWNYYDRALDRAAGDEVEAARADLEKALSLRPTDQHMARTYGMHFTDYFPHRELGVIFYRKGDLDRARNELEQSVAMQETAKGAYYLNLVRKKLFERRGETFSPPAITVASPPADAAVSALTVRVRGKAATPGLVARLTINGTALPVDLAKGEVPFDREVEIADGEGEVTIEAEDLLGARARQVVKIAVDRDGPSVALAGVTILPGGGVRLTGTVEDRSGVRSVSIGETVLDPEGKRTLPFDVSVSGRKGATVEIRAVDALGNETIATVDPAREVATARPRILLAAAGSFTLFDREPPAIALKEAAGSLPVFVDRYVVEGEASDGGGLDRLRVNGQEAAIAKGKKVYFSKTVKLAEGDNRIVVEAFDRSGNRGEATFTVRRSIPAVFGLASRMSISPLPVEGKKALSVGPLADDLLAGALVDQKRFQVVERAKLQQILQEQKLSAANLVEAEHAVRVGRLTAAEAILVTAVREDPRSVELVSRVVSTETGEVLEVQDSYTETKTPAGLRETFDALAAKIARRFPVVSGTVIGRDGGEVLTDLGSAARIHRGSGVVFYRKGNDLRHPRSGRSLGADTVVIGEGAFTEIEKEYSRLRLSGKGTEGIGVRDYVITR